MNILKESTIYALICFGCFGTLASCSFQARHCAGLFDVDDNRTLDELEFASFVTAFIYALGAAFGLRHRDDILPSTKSIKILGFNKNRFPDVTCVVCDRP